MGDQPKNKRIDTASAASLQTDIARQLSEKITEQKNLLCIAASIAAARTRADLWNIINSDILDLFGGVYYTLCLVNEDGKTHSPFLHSRDNSLQHSGASQIEVRLQVNDNHLEVILSDNGCGFNAKKQTMGMGIKNVESRVKSHHGTIKIKSALQKGTQFCIRIPLLTNPGDG